MLEKEESTIARFSEEEIVVMLNAAVEKQIDTLLKLALQTGASFNEHSYETHAALFKIAAQRESLLKFVAKAVS